MMKYLPENRPDHTCNRAVPEPPVTVAGRPALGVAVPVTAQKNLDRPGGEARPSMQSGGAATVAGRPAARRDETCQVIPLCLRTAEGRGDGDAGGMVTRS